MGLAVRVLGEVSPAGEGMVVSFWAWLAWVS